MSRVPLVVVLVTAGSRREADRIAAALVEERLVACVNLVAPIVSIYQWEGNIERSREVMLIAKTRRTLIGRLTARVQELHSYNVPEIIVLPIEGGSIAYREWVAGETRPARRKPAPKRRQSRR